MLLLSNILCSLYELTLLMSRTINNEIHLKFRCYDSLFNHLKKVKSFIEVNNCFYKKKIIEISKTSFEKLTKYYSKTKDKENLIYNLVNVLNFTQKLILYTAWNAEVDEDANNAIYEKKYKAKFMKYYRKNYEHNDNSVLVKQ